MKKMLKKVTAVLLAAIIIAAGTASTVVKAAGTEVVINVKNEAGWESMSVYNWGDGGETAGAWPGTEMEVIGDDWCTYTISTECDLNLVFSQAGSPQSSNIEGLSMNAGEVWVVVGGEGEANDMGVASIQAVLYTEAEEGWPTSAVATAVVTEETTVATQDTTPKTNDTTPIVPIVIAGMGSLLIATVAFIKKKENIK